MFQIKEKYQNILMCVWTRK